jgi:hypothetical protein
LDVEDRAALAEKLLASLEELSGPEADRLWGEEARRRGDAFHGGLAETVPADEVAGKAEKLFR